MSVVIIVRGSRFITFIFGIIKINMQALSSRYCSWSIRPENSNLGCHLLAYIRANIID